MARFRLLQMGCGDLQRQLARRQEPHAARHRIERLQIEVRPIVVGFPAVEHGALDFPFLPEDPSGDDAEGDVSGVDPVV